MRELEQEYHAAVDIPIIDNLLSDNENIRGEWACIQYFYTKEEAIEWAKENLGADDEGKICVVSTF